MTGSPTIAELVVGGSPDRWRAAGFTVDADNRVVIGTVTIRLSADSPPGIASWSLRAPVPSMIDGLATSASTAEIPDAAVHPNHVVAIDHLVVLTPDLDRTIDALAEQGLELRRVREGPAGDGREVKQAFFRMAEVILEVVATGRGGDDRSVLGAHVPVRTTSTPRSPLGPIASARPRRGADRTPHRDGARVGRARRARRAHGPLNRCMSICMWHSSLRARDLLGVLLRRRG
jgi:hypothetical protein